MPPVSDTKRMKRLDKSLAMMVCARSEAPASIRNAPAHCRADNGCRTPTIAVERHERVYWCSLEPLRRRAAKCLASRAETQRSISVMGGEQNSSAPVEAPIAAPLLYGTGINHCTT